MVDPGIIAKGGNVIGNVVAKIAGFFGWATSSLQGNFLILLVACGLIIWLYLMALKDRTKYMQHRRRFR